MPSMMFFFKHIKKYLGAKLCSKCSCNAIAEQEIDLPKLYIKRVLSVLLEPIQVKETETQDCKIRL
jgi:predicted nucleic-acid-binding Zn-ribbon protein